MCKAFCQMLFHLNLMGILGISQDIFLILQMRNFMVRW